MVNIDELIKGKKLPMDYDELVILAGEIERAVLAKAMPIPKQEPALFVKFDANGEFVTARRNQKGLVFDCDASYVAYYAEPQPAQAAAIPNGVITGVLSSILLCRREPMAPHNVAALREHLGERTDEELTFYIQNGRWPLSASPKPE